MLKLISYPLSILFGILFFLWLLLFHPIQWFCLKFFGYNTHRISVAILNAFLVRTTHVLGTTYKIKGIENIPKNKPLIIVANHQSLYDIPPFIWFLRKYHPKFISKKELGKKIPSVSFNLRHGGSALIDRKDPKQALPEIKRVAEYINQNNYSVVIFPEGTRSKTGVPKPFSINGLKMLYKFAPDAYFLPVTINNSWKMTRYGQFPLGLGSNIEHIIHPPLKISDYSFDDIFKKTETIIKEHIK
ncbi:1-acyl-sn-glycerol-3-phosphate acyltransferase [Flavobacterium columnare NBRC 100251 = ATCC 23463]|uniref:Phospholipid/glycerol acyltransferase n=2 Tax=Flavobacterium columnare TaxID=996 RepID=G8XBC2_FLACA|nr:lysophospholipid acyltransferase family protein [Flavobacterium columnare]AEW86702.1 phospholipid/glycerol acyltransferase [Flavobacterium columnare ATCC 49512]AMO20587.1 1-acyl-sn-glycerol-3-phosphate acyltransferase [Flavobacterium columnare]ANO47114.1 phospholipid/glycerol acyltransferase [Flavobacterium columnare]APT22201.1 1-acyl-sn-glycerol-3-phosphate acyltransferase [Flavobacterium columnare]AUX18561.1 glycerol acyltransferase [Flavobacterium columnare]